ncbi:MAG TPA: DUF5684 domain-containing protein [Nevskiaceae bacterium]|nr:DUF5684 domain-containing protein [Nevskiaceae bacterium]
MLQAFAHFGQSYDYTYNVTSTGNNQELSGFMVGMAIVVLVVAVVLIASMWKMFTKAGKPGWAAIVPIYNLIVLLQIIGRPLWWIVFYVLSFIPFVGYVISLVVDIIVSNDLAKSFGKGTNYTVLLVLLPFIGYPMLAFGDAKYQGPAAAGTTGGVPKPTAQPPKAA